jgi:hypothetical protein
VQIGLLIDLRERRHRTGTFKRPSLSGMYQGLHLLNSSAAACLESFG